MVLQHDASKVVAPLQYDFKDLDAQLAHIEAIQRDLQRSSDPLRWISPLKSSFHAIAKPVQNLHQVWDHSRRLDMALAGLRRKALAARNVLRKRRSRLGAMRRFLRWKILRAGVGRWIERRF
jgi:hypothetical protein